MIDEGSLRTEINNIKEDIVEIKANAKEINNKVGIELLFNHDTNIRNEIQLASIVQKQKDAEEGQKLLVEMVQTVQDKPFIEWNKMKGVWKVAIVGAVIGFIVPWVIGNFMTFAKIFYK